MSTKKQPHDTPTPSDAIFDALLTVLGEYDKKRVYFSDVANACYSAKVDLRKVVAAANERAERVEKELKMWRDLNANRIRMQQGLPRAE